MTWIQVKRKVEDDGSGGESNSHINNKRKSGESNSRNCSYLKRTEYNGTGRRKRIPIRRGDDSDNANDAISNSIRNRIPASFWEKEGIEPKHFLEEWTSSWDNSICGTGKLGRDNSPTLNELGDDDDLSPTSIFHQSQSQSAVSGSVAFNRHPKNCNQPDTPTSSSTISTSSCSPISSWWLFLLVLSWNMSSTSSFCPPYCSCDDIALSVDCHHSASNLRVVPIFLNPQIKFLSLSKNQIKDITMSLQFYSELQVLDISHNKLESLGKTNFESLKRLHLLNVSYNAIKSLENGAFTGLAHVKTLDLSGNQLEKVEQEIFWSLTSVKEIILDRNRLEILDWTVFHGLDTLEKISAKFNFIQVIEPSSTITMPRGNSMGGVGGAERELKRDNDININNNRSRSGRDVPTLWTLKNVRYLDLSSNQLTRVKDYGLVTFGALKELNLCCNYIHTLEEKAFFISSSPSTRKTSSGHLERLNLSQNRLGRVPTEALEKVGSTLRQLDLSSNRISDHISKNAFRTLVHLESVRLSDNPEILYIDQDALSENSNLINFEADYLSNLTEISPALLRNKNFLENFSLKYASISQLSPEFFQPPVSDIVGCLDLTGNPIDCNCSAHSFYQFITETLGASYPSSAYAPDSPYDFDQSIGGGAAAGIDGVGSALRDENNNLIHEHAFRSSNPPNGDQVEGKSNFSTGSKSESLLASHSNPNLISYQSTPSRSSSSPTEKKKSNLSNNNKNGKTRPNLLYVRCQSPPNLGGVLVKDLKSSDFQHCFVADDQFQIMVICIAGGILSLIFLTLAIKLCCASKASRRLSTFCKTHCSATNCCHKLTKSRKEKKQSSSDKLFFDSMTIALRRDLGMPLGTTSGAAGGGQPPNLTSNANILPNGKSILGGELLYIGNGIPHTAGGCIIGGGNSSATLGRNGNGNHPITMSMDYDDCYRDDDDDDDEDEDEDDEEEQVEQQHQLPHHRSHSQQQHYGQLERSYAPIEPPPPIPTTPIPLQFSNQVQSLSRKQQKQMLLQQHHLHGHQHHSPTMGYSPKHYSQHNIHNHHTHQHHHLPPQHASPKHSQQQQQNPPVIVHYEYPDFPSMHRVKQVPSVLV